MNPGEQRHRLLPVPAKEFGSRSLIEGYVDRLNRGSQIAERRILGWSGERNELKDSLSLSLIAPSDQARDALIAEAQMSFGFDVTAHRPAGPTAPYTVGVLLAGSMQLMFDDGPCTLAPGECVVMDPAHVERTRFDAGSHFVEFSLPKQYVIRLGAELSPGDFSAAPRFVPKASADLARRLLFMANEAALQLSRPGKERAAQLISRRWLEMVALTLLDGQEQRGDSAESQGPPSGLSQARLRRAMEFIDAHAQRDIDMADVARAAHASASSLLRVFKEHLGMSPGAYLRQVRLDRARIDLRSAEAGPIREVALRWGFLSASKFSEAYLRRFGELPSATTRSL